MRGEKGLFRGIFLCAAAVVFLLLFSCAGSAEKKTPEIPEDIPAPKDFVSTQQEEAEPEDLPVSRELSPEEALFVENFLSDLSFMVYHPEPEKNVPEALKDGVGRINSWLAEQGYRYVQTFLIDMLKEDPEALKVYTEETEKRIGLVQWIARKTSADIYISLTGSAASFSLTAFDVASGKILGSVSLQSLENLAAVLPEFVESLGQEIRETLYRGIKYTITIDNLSQESSLAAFERALEPGLRSLRRLSSSPGQAIYDVYMLGTAQDLEGSVYLAARDIPGLLEMTLVLQQGNHLFFDLGMLP